MSLNGSGPILSRTAQDRISALSSANKRLMGEKKELSERVTTLTGIAQAHADDRDSYIQQAAEAEQERDTARSIAIELEQQLAAIGARVIDLRDLYARRYCDDPSESNAIAVRVVQELDAAINHITDTVTRDLCDDAREAQ
jgi:hypothetical protein